MHICICMHIHIHTYIYTFKDLHAITQTQTHIPKYACLYTNIRTVKNVYINVHTYANTLK